MRLIWLSPSPEIDPEVDPKQQVRHQEQGHDFSSSPHLRLSQATEALGLLWWRRDILRCQHLAEIAMPDLQASGWIGLSHLILGNHRSFRIPEGPRRLSPEKLGPHMPEQFMSGGLFDICPGYVTNLCAD